MLLVDNTKLNFDIKSIRDANILQSGFNKFFQWSEQNLLALKMNKWQVISYTFSKNAIIFQYQINNNFLNGVNSIKDLDAYFKNNL